MKDIGESVSLQTIKNVTDDFAVIRKDFASRVVGHFHEMGDAEKKADKNTVYADAVAESLIEKEYFLRKVYENPAIDRTIRNAASMGQTQIYSYMRESVVMRQSYVEKVYGGDFSSYRQDLNVAKAADKDMSLPRTLAEDIEEDKETERD